MQKFYGTVVPIMTPLTWDDKMTKVRRPMENPTPEQGKDLLKRVRELSYRDVNI